MVGDVFSSMMKGCFAMLYGFLVFCICWLLVYINNYCKNPYKLEAVVGSKGSGKSLYMSRVANYWMRNNKGLIYSNMGIGYELEPEYWKQSFLPDSLILIDEIGVIHSNRDFKSMPSEAIEFFKMQRKHHLTIIVSSQTMDFDKKVRDLCDKIYVCNRLGWFCRLRPYRAAIGMASCPDGGEDLVNTVRKAGSPKWYTIPKSVKQVSALEYDTEQIISKTPSK